ncbi:glutathione S-transferase T3-like [Apium graveolens]|uniref:glutathione S-transferase T3-like n=1 Tax=Apium graveolens TaxID=4045 RepID=UPI003D7BA307
MDLLLVELEPVKKENQYLKNKLKGANDIEAMLRENIEKNENSLEAQVSAFGSENIIDLNDNYEETEDLREITGLWKWVEDKLLISAWLNVSIDPLVSTDQKDDRSCGNEKRWQRINDGAQKFGAYYDKVQRKIGSGSNLDKIIEKSHQDHLTNYKKKSNFELHWCEFRRHPKWRTPPSSVSSKRNKLCSCGAYSSEGNNDTPISDEFEPVRPKGTKAATKRKRKGKATTVEVDEWKSLQVNHERKMDIMDKLNKIRLKELEAKQSEMDLEVIMADTTKMNDAQRKAHAKLLEKIMSKN